MKKPFYLLLLLLSFTVMPPLATAEDKVIIEGNKIIIQGDATSSQTSNMQSAQPVKPPIETKTFSEEDRRNKKAIEEQRAWRNFYVSKGMSREKVEAEAARLGIRRITKYEDANADKGKSFWVFEYEKKTENFKFTKKVIFDSFTWQVEEIINLEEPRW